MKRDITRLTLLTIGAALVYPNWIGLDYPLALEWIGFALLWVAIIWQAIDTIKEVAHDGRKVRPDHRK